MTPSNTNPKGYEVIEYADALTSIQQGKSPFDVKFKKHYIKLPRGFDMVNADNLEKALFDLGWMCSSLMIVLDKAFDAYECVPR